MTAIIERNLNIKINKDSFNYSRFVTHLQYLLKRVQNNKTINTENKNIYDEVKRQYPDIFQCVEIIRNYFKSSISIELSDEECLYLMLHSNRLYNREGQ